MEFVTRLASSSTQYPLPTQGETTWQQAPKGGWQTELELPPLPKDHIVVPSFCTLDDAQAPYQFTLHTPADRYALNPVPSRPEDRLNPRPAAEISCHIDCWHTHNKVNGARILLQVGCEHAPTRYLLTVSLRPLELADEEVPLPPATSIMVDVPENISQMTAAENIRARICSPTALAMALSAMHKQVDWSAAVAACYDPLTKAYGAWPLAIRHAASYNTIAAVECFSRWSEVVQVLQAGSPLVCSIRFGKEQLQSAPLAQTGGHLVVLHGIEGNSVLVKDPAARQHADVAHRYLAAEFSRAWLQRRGAAYIFAPLS